MGGRRVFLCRACLFRAVPTPEASPTGVGHGPARGALLRPAELIRGQPY